MTDANLIRVLQAQTRLKVGHVAYDVVAAGPEKIRERYAALQADGVSFAVVDAVSDDDLMRIGRSLRDMPLVTAGSGIAIGLPQNFVEQGLLRAAGTAPQLPHVAGHKAIVSGSCSVMTNRQVAHFVRAGGEAYALDALNIATAEAAAERALRWAQPRLSNGPVLIYSTADPAAVSEVQKRYGVAVSSALIEDALTSVARGLIRAGVSQLVVAGGETAGAVVGGLAIRALRIGRQIDPGVPWTCTLDEKPILLALKSGNFGSEDFFTRAFQVAEAS
jgi:uncharacterized protein YgbK (DUF1537 family)